MFEKITENVENISLLPDTPAMPADQLKKEFDKGNKTIKEKFNKLIDSIVDKDAEPNERTIYNSKAVCELIGKPSFCKMTTNFKEKVITEPTKITGFKDAINYGDYIADVTNSRLEIKNTKLLQLSGSASGLRFAQCYFVIKDSEGNLVESSLGKVLYQFGGNGYWQAPLQTTTIELDPTKTYYVTLNANPYDTESFLLNGGFGESDTWIGATKIL